MKVAVAGSWKAKEASEWGLKSQDLFPKACQQIGNAIMRLGHTLVIGSESEGTADRYAVEGAIQAIGGSTPDRPRIVILRPNDQRVSFEQLRNENPGLFTTRVSMDSGWNVTKLFQVNEADGLVVVGGAEFSYQAGLAAALCKKPLVPVGSFGGAAKKLLNVLAVSRNSWPGNLPSEDDLGLLHGGWNKFLLDKTIGLLGLSRLPTLLIIHGRSNDKLSLKNYLQNQLHFPEPLIMAEQPGVGLTLPEKFEAIAKRCDGAIALATPDDRGALASDVQTDSQGALRARQNVWLEVGWFWGTLGRRRFLLLCRKDIEIPSDLAGLEYLRYESDPAERGDDIRKFAEDLHGSIHA
jgi:Predicted nucleotide-binding protein containing TIR-like domain